MAAHASASQPPSATDLAAVFSGARWCDVALRKDLLPTLGANVLLHAGPPFQGDIPEAVRTAAAQALVYEGLARDPDDASALLSGGTIRMMPAQDHLVATPLAQVVSASMPLAVVGGAGRIAFAPLIEGPPPAVRFGSGAAEALERLRRVSALGLRNAASLRGAPIALASIVEHALNNGDECHARTGMANHALVDAMPWLDDDDRQLLLSSPGFVLPILMAAAVWALHGAASARRGATIAAAGGNGVMFGIRLHGEAGWRSIPATPPRGTRFPGHGATEALGAIGDSAVVDFCGLGGQALSFAPLLCDEWKSALPNDLAQRRQLVIDPATGCVDLQRCIASRQMPLIDLAVLDLDGTAGLIGRGVYEPPLALFETHPPRVADTRV